MREKGNGLVRTAAAGLLCVGLVGAGGAAAQEPPQVKIPEPGVPQIMTMEGRFIRAAYNNEGYTILGYRIANDSVGEPWMLLEVGFALRDRVPDYVMTRDALSLETPDGKTIPLATVPEFRQANLSALGGPGEPAARLDQLLSAERAHRPSYRVLQRCRLARDGVGHGRVHRPAGLPRPALLPGTGRCSRSYSAVAPPAFSIVQGVIAKE
jgi:hypothetical protein